MKRWERIAATILALVGVGAALGALQIGFGSFKNPGPGFLPFWLAVLLTIVSVIYYIANLGKDRKVKLWPKGTWVRPVLAITVMIIYAFFMKWFGFCTATFLLFIAWMTLVEREKWLTVALVSILGTTVTYILFALLLKVPLPTGLLI